jgi:spore germination protein YaaH
VLFRPTFGRRFTSVTAALAVMAGTVTALAVGVTAAAPAAQAATPQRDASGWITYFNAAGAASVANNADLFSDVSEFWFHAASATGIVASGTTSTSQLTSSIATMRSHGVAATITVTDGTGSGGMENILANPTLRTEHAAALVALAVRYGASGIDLDYENMAIYANGKPALAAPTRAGFDALLQQLAPALHARGMILTVDVMTKTSEPGTSPAGQVYDYPTIGRYADKVRILTYDEHYSGTAYPGGPISSVAWVQSILNFAVTVIPASKIYLGVPLYGYNWTNNGKSATSVTYAQAIALQQQYHATRQWSAADGEPYFTYTDAAHVQHTVWYNDAQALEARLPLIGKYGLGGVAFWSFGQEDPGIYGVMRSYMYGPNPFGNFEGVSAWPGGVRMTGWAIDPNATTPINVDIYSDGKFVARTSAGVNRPDVGNLFSAYGSAHGFDTIVDLPAGKHQICAYGINTGPGTENSQLGCKTETVLSNAPHGSFDAAGGSAGTLTVSGWAIDPDTALPIGVHVYVDGKFAGSTTASNPRPDVAKLYPGWGADHGFTTSVNVSGGTHQVCVYGINAGLGNVNPSLGCRTVTITSGDPSGHLESVTTSSNTIVAKGWTIDPNTASPIDVAIYVDGKNVSTGTAALPRPDVAAAYPAFGPDHGFLVTSGVSAGSHQVCAYGINTGAGTANTLLGCDTVVVPSGNPIGDLEHVTGGKGTVLATGWALDPDTTAPISVVVFVDGVKTVTQVALGLRPDIAASHPGAGADHGFAASAPVAKAGKHTVCVFALNTGPGTANTDLGCQSVTTK